MLGGAQYVCRPQVSVRQIFTKSPPSQKGTVYWPQVRLKPRLLQ